MKKLCSKGFKISNADQKALDHYLNVTPLKWSQDALKGKINKAIKTILKDYFELYKSKQTGSISSDLSVLIPAIVAMDEFVPYNIPTPTKFDKFDKGDLDVVQRDESKSNEIWSNGFDIEDYEEIALKAYFANHESYLDWLMENKIYRRKNAFIKEHEKEMIKNKEIIPARHDAFINQVVAKPGYKNRIQRDEELFNQISA